MEYFGQKLFRPSEDYKIGITGGPILPEDIFNCNFINEPLDYQVGRYCLLYSPVTPTGQKLALIIALSGLLNEISVISTNNGRLISSSRNGENSLTWVNLNRSEESAFSIARSIRLPALVDLHKRQVVSNDPYLLPVKIIYDLALTTGRDISTLPISTNFDGQLELESRIFYDLHAAVYRAGFISDQGGYENEVEQVYRFLAYLNQRLSGKRYLFGDSISSSDIWLFTLLIRYDQVYMPGFRLHKYRLRDFPEVWRYLCDLYSIQEFSFTTDFSLISRGYFLGIPALNRGIVPKGPDDFFLLGLPPHTHQAKG